MTYDMWALGLLITFIVSVTVGGFLFGLGSCLWPGFMCLGVASLVGSYMLGSD